MIPGLRMEPEDDEWDHDEPVGRELDDPREMTFVEHLEEMRGMLFKSLAALIVGGITVGVFLRQFAALLNEPLFRAMEGREMVVHGLRTDGLIDAFTIVLQMCFLGGLMLALPFILYFIAQFVAPGLTRREKAFLRPGLLAGFGLFLAGASLSFYILVPAAVKASFYLNDLLGTEPVWSAAKWYGMLIWMTVGVGLAFEFPLVLLVLIQLGLVGVARLRGWRSHAVVTFLIVSAIITPSGDPFTFLLLAGPLYVLYEITLVIGAYVESRLAAARAAEEAEEMENG